MKFSLLQLTVCVALVVLIAVLVLNFYNPKLIPQNSIEPKVSIPFMDIKMK